MTGKIIKATPEEIRKIHYALFSDETIGGDTSASLIMKSGLLDRLTYMTHKNIYFITRIDSTGVFEKDFEITKQEQDAGLMGKSPSSMIFADDVDFDHLKSDLKVQRIGKFKGDDCVIDDGRDF